MLEWMESKGLTNASTPGIKDINALQRLAWWAKIFNFQCLLLHQVEILQCYKYYKGWSGATKTIYLSMSFASSKYCKGTGLVGGNHFKNFSQGWYTLQSAVSEYVGWIHWRKCLPFSLFTSSSICSCLFWHKFHVILKFCKHLPKKKWSNERLAKWPTPLPPNFIFCSFLPESQFNERH